MARASDSTSPARRWGECTSSVARDMRDAGDFQRFLDRYQAEVPIGIAGEHEMRRRIKIPFMDTTPEDVRREPTIAELNGWRTYMGWSLWDVIAARSTEGESG